MPTATPTLPPAPARQPFTIEGLAVTVPGYSRIEMAALSSTFGSENVAESILERVGVAFPDRAPRSLQILLLLGPEDATYTVIGVDTEIDRYLSVQSVRGFLVAPIEGLLPDIGWKGGLIISDDIQLADATLASPREIIDEPDAYALRRVRMDTTYILGSARIKDSKVLRHIGFALATDALASSDPSDYLTVIDPYNTETQIRDADVFGTVLFPSANMRRMLTEGLGIAQDDVTEILAKPVLFFERLADDGAELRNIKELVPTFTDPTPKLHTWHGQTVSIKGLALGAMVATEDIELLRNSPVQVTGKVEGVVDLTGAMALAGITSGDERSDVTVGHYRYELAVHRFEGEIAFAFVLRRTPVPLDPVEDVQRAHFGDRVVTELSGYEVLELPELQVTSDLTLAQVELLTPTTSGDPIILTQHPQLATGDYLKTVMVDGFLISGAFLGVPEELRLTHGDGVLVVGEDKITFEKAARTPGPPKPPPAPTPTAPAAPAPTPTPIPTSVGTPTPTASAAPAPTPTATPTPTPTPTPMPAPTPTATATPTATPSAPDTTQTAEITPSKDNTLYESASGALSNGAGSFLFAGKTNSGFIRRALIAFDVAGSIPAGSAITSATLRMHVSRTTSGSQKMELRKLLADWGQGASVAGGNQGAGAPAATGDATWVHRLFDSEQWQTPGGDFSAVASGATNVGGIRDYVWESTDEMKADVQTWLDEAATNFGWILLGNESSVRTTKRFDSSESASKTDRPTLVIEFVPPG